MPRLTQCDQPGQGLREEAILASPITQRMLAAGEAADSDGTLQPEQENARAWPSVFLLRSNEQFQSKHMLQNCFSSSAILPKK